MTTYAPTIHTAPAVPPPPATGPKLEYAIGDPCWIHVGGTTAGYLTPGKVVFWFDLPDLAMRFYVIRLRDSDYMHLQLRDATLMAESLAAGMPFTKTRHDDTRPDPTKGAAERVN